MTAEIHALFKHAMPAVHKNEAHFKRIVGNEENHIISHVIDGDLVGVSVINDNVIYLLCVNPSFRRQGIGSMLLQQSEAYIKSQGYVNLKVGAGRSYITPGVPIDGNSDLFFAKRGYTHSWGDDECFDMELQLADFIDDGHTLGDMIDGIRYRWATIDDLDATLQSVADGAGTFVPFYRDRELYLAPIENTPKSRRVLVAAKDHEIAGALIVYLDITDKNKGAVGCTATRTAHQGKGIATNMVRLGTKYLKDIGIKHAFAEYTYTAIQNIYGRSGYRITTRYFMAEKQISVVESEI
jgi:ribosomal protein S18 acetylase RimI-like enzyme